jgi:transposase
MGKEGFRRFGPQSSPQSSSADKPDHRIELITGRLRRRSWTDAEKAAIVAESLEPGAKVTSVARRHRITRGLLWSWQQQIAGLAGEKAAIDFVPLRLASVGFSETPRPGAVPDPSAVPVPCAGEDPPAGSIEIEVGRARVRVQGCVDLQALRQVLTVLGRAS